MSQPISLLVCGDDAVVNMPELHETRRVIRQGGNRIVKRACSHAVRETHRSCSSRGGKDGSRFPPPAALSSNAGYPFWLFSRARFVAQRYLFSRDRDTLSTSSRRGPVSRGERVNFADEMQSPVLVDGVLRSLARLLEDHMCVISVPVDDECRGPEPGHILPATILASTLMSYGSATL